MRVSLVRAAHLVARVLLPPGVRVDVVAQHAAHVIGGFVPLDGVCLALGANGEAGPLRLLELPPGVGEFGFDVHLVRGVTNQDVFLVCDVQQLLGHLLETFVRLRPFLLKVLRVGLSRPQLRLGELAPVSLLLRRGGALLRLLHAPAKLPVVAHVTLHLLHAIAKPVAFVLGGVDAFLQRGDLLRRRRRFANAVQGLLLDVVELPRHLAVTRRRLPPLVVTFLPRGVQHPLHLSEGGVSGCLNGA